MMDSKLQDVVRAVLEKTEVGELEWRAFSDELFQATVAGRVVQVTRGSDRFEVNESGDTVWRTVYSVAVTDKFGRVVAEDRASEVGNATLYAMLERLFNVARKAALASDEELDSLLTALRSKV
jgi:hypothetical protein